jgi:hypothetical protein
MCARIGWRIVSPRQRRTVDSGAQRLPMLPACPAIRSCLPPVRTSTGKVAKAEASRDASPKARKTKPARTGVLREGCYGTGSRGRSSRN